MSRRALPRQKEPTAVRIAHPAVPPLRAPLSIEMGVHLNTLAREGKPDVLQQWVVVGADVNAVDYDGRSPLHIGASEGHKAVVNILLQSGARPDVKDRWGNTAQICAEQAKKQVAHSTEQIMGIVRAMDAGIGNVRALESRAIGTWGPSGASCPPVQRGCATQSSEARRARSDMMAAAR